MLNAMPDAQVDGGPCGKIIAYDIYDNSDYVGRVSLDVPTQSGVIKLRGQTYKIEPIEQERGFLTWLESWRGVFTLLDGFHTMASAEAQNDVRLTHDNRDYLLQ